jgi:hypothetical protein
LRRHAEFADAPRLTLAISGESGLIGSELTPVLTTGGHRVRPLVRREARTADEIPWDPAEGRLNPEALEGVDAVVNLSGANIGARWTEGYKKLLRSSRIDSTRTLCEAIARMKRPPRVLVSGSAVGIYGDTGDREVDESSPAGDDFLGELARDWEAATRPAADAGVRVVHLRTGVVLSLKGGALQKMWTPFSMGVGGVIGDGRQFLSWISMDDLMGVIYMALHRDDLSGPLNAVTDATDNVTFTRTLGKVLSRPTIIPVPSLAVKTLFGEMGENLLLSSTRARAPKLRSMGFQYIHPTLEEALRAATGNFPPEHLANWGEPLSNVESTQG